MDRTLLPEVAILQRYPPTHAPYYACRVQGLRCVHVWAESGAGLGCVSCGRSVTGSERDDVMLRRVWGQRCV
eukprot:938676-Rhodomonas_salina.2